MGFLVMTLPVELKAQFTFTTNNGDITITGYIGSEGNIDIPASTNGYPVTMIGNSAFYFKTTMTNVTIPNSITSIGDSAFAHCSVLTSVTIGNSVTTIGTNAFDYCSGLTSVAIPDSVTSIGDSAFSSCSSLTNVTIPSSVIAIGYGAFALCQSLTNITVNAPNPGYASAGGVLFNKSLTLLIQCPGGLTGSYAVPNNVTCIGNYAFAACYGLTNVTIGNSVATIGTNAFWACSGLTSMTIPSSVTSIGDNAFVYCSGLTNVTIGNGVSKIGKGTFVYCSGLTSVRIPDSVTTIGTEAFAVCSSLTSVMIPDSVINIGGAAFYNCSGLTNVTIPDSVATIGGNAFAYCYGLTSMTIPSSVTSIGDNAFYDCISLHKAYFQGNAPSVNGGLGSSDVTVFSGKSGAVYYVPGTTGWGATPRTLHTAKSLSAERNFMEFIIFLIVVAPIVLAIWLIVRTVQSGKRIEDLSDRLQNLELEIIRLKNQKSETAAEPKQSPAPETSFSPPTKAEPAAETLVATLEHLQQQTPSIPSLVPPTIKPLLASPPIFSAAKSSEPEIGPQSSEPKPEPQIKPSTPPPPKGSFEMRLGTYWLVRIGIVMLLTGLVFFGNYAYHNFINKIGAVGKVSLLYLASATLLGAGAWWQRKAFKESLRNYAQVLFAGGLAAVYFTTYAAHHIPQLRIIESPVLDGALLLAWAGVMVWIADRRKSELFALFAVALAYYTSVITHVGAFTLYSNLVLALIAVIVLVRNRWAGLSFASLVATYAGYAFWRFLQNDGWRWASPDEGLWFGVYFLMTYWAVFTAAVFLSKSEKLTGESRAGFLTLNNGAFFALFLLTMIQVRQGGFWKFSLAYGIVLLGLSGLTKFYLPKEPLAKNSYLTQGLLLVTLGFITKFAGLKLALVLGTESVVLFILGTQQKSLLLQIGGYLAAALAVGWAFDGLERFDNRGIWLGSALGALMIVNSVWASRQKIGKDFILRPVPVYFALLGLTVWFYTTYQNTTTEIFSLALAIESVVLTFSIYLLQVREITLLGQCFLFVAQVLWIDRLIESHTKVPWWNPALLIAVSLGLSHWWQRQKILVIDGQLRLAWQGFYGLAIMGLLYFWLQPLVSIPDWLALTSLLAIGITAYGVYTRTWLLALCGQIFLFVSAGQFALQLLHEKPEWYFPLAPVAAFGLLSFATVRWFMAKPDSDPKIRDGVLVFAQLYRWIALVMSVWWVCEYVPERERAWVLMTLGFLAFLLAGWRRNREALLFGAAFTASGLVYMWVHPHDEPMVYVPNLIAILILLAQQQVARRLPERFNLEEPIHTAAIIIGCGSLWRYLSVWVSMGTSGFYLTASWSALALLIFVCGIVLRERIYRWVGLAVLAAALGRVVLFDVWKQERIYQVLTFMALGIVLLVLGFVYNKYQDKIRQWL